MSYKKIVAGIATFAVASAMVVPAAFADPGVNEEGNTKSDVFTYTEKAFPGKTWSELSKEEKQEVLDLISEGKYNEARTKEFNDKKDAALKAGRTARTEALKMLDRSSKITVGEREYTVAGLLDTIDAYIAKVEAMTPEKNAIHEIDNYGNWLKDAAAALQKFVNAVPDAKPAAEKKAEKAAKADKAAAKAGKLPKTADQAPVAPFAAVAGSAALIAAGLVASRKVNA